MKVESLKRLDAADFPEVPEGLLDTLNEMFEEVTTALQGALTFGDNVRAEVKAIRMEHEVEREIELKALKSAPLVVALATPGTYDYFRYKWKTSKTGAIKLVVSWDSAPAGLQTVIVVVIGR